VGLIVLSVSVGEKLLGVVGGGANLLVFLSERVRVQFHNMRRWSTRRLKGLKQGVGGVMKNLKWVIL